MGELLVGELIVQSSGNGLRCRSAMDSSCYSAR